MQNTQLLATQLQRHFLWLFNWFEKHQIYQQLYSKTGLSKMVSLLRTLRLNKQVDKTLMLNNCFAAIKRIEMAKLL